MKNYFTYIMSSISGVLYIGVTNNLERRISQHKRKSNKSFISKYNINKLVYYEVFNNIYFAIAREKQLKKWNRMKKIKLITNHNPLMKDLMTE